MTAPPKMINIQEASANARKQADAYASDDMMARGKGFSPQQIAARKRVAKLFCEMHLQGEPAEMTAGRLAAIDYTEPVSPVNGRNVDMQNPKSRGFMGLGRKPGYLVSTRFAPKKPEDPIYALEYFPHK